MGKADTQYAENARLTKLKQLDTFGLNPHACHGLFESYIKNVAPLPIKYVYYMTRKDAKKDGVTESKGMVELYISTAGYVGNRQGDIAKISQVHANLFCRSYYEGMRPTEIYFQLADSVEFYLKTPGVSESNHNVFNPFKNIYNPTEERKPKKRRP